VFGSLQFKSATEVWEIEQIHQLNYRTFVEEIPQHHTNPSHRLVDKFHSENTYIICLDRSHVVGMIAVRDRRPFSLDAKLDNLDALLPAGRKLCEIRLLAVDKKHRNGWVFWGLGKLLTEYCQQRLYKHLGFMPFGPLVGTAEAPFQPMYLSFESFQRRARMFRRALGRDSVSAELKELIEADDVQVHGADDR
jgi:hypothetical protein